MEELNPGSKSRDENGGKVTLTCLIMALKASRLSFMVRISPDLPKQKPCNKFTDRRYEHTWILTFITNWRNILIYYFIIYFCWF